MRMTDVFLAFPRLILALAFVAALGPGIENAVLAIALTAWPPYARLARAETLALRQRDFIAAVRLAGASPSRIVVRHIVPLCLPSVIVRVTLDMAGIILTAAGLGFLGLGAQPPIARMGRDDRRRPAIHARPVVGADDARHRHRRRQPGFNLLGDGLRDVLDPQAAMSAPLLEIARSARALPAARRARRCAACQLRAGAREARHRRRIRLGQVARPAAPILRLLPAQRDA